MTLKLVADVALCVLAVEQLAFTLLYVLRSPWWTTRLGVIYAAKSLVWTLVVLQVTASVLSQSDYPYRHWFRLGIYAGGAAAMVGLTVVLWRFQQQGKAERRAAGDMRSQPQLWADTLREWARR